MFLYTQQFNDISYVSKYFEKQMKKKNINVNYENY